MGQKKGIVPAHIQPKTFMHPGESSPWIVILSQVEDPRKPSCNTRHSVVGTRSRGVRNCLELTELKLLSDKRRMLESETQTSYPTVA